MLLMNQREYPFNNMISDIFEDYRRYKKYKGENKYHIILFIMTVLESRGLWSVAHYRFGRWVFANFNNSFFNPVNFFLKVLFYIGRLFIIFMTKSHISIESIIGPGLFISNNGNIILSAQLIGKNCTVSHNVTSGKGKDNKLPIYGDNVYIGSNSIIYGGIIVETNAVILSNSVVSKNIKKNSCVSGNPCRTVKKRIVFH